MTNPTVQHQALSCDLEWISPSDSDPAHVRGRLKGTLTLPAHAERKRREWVLPVIQILLTTILGFIVFWAQTSVTTALAHESATLASRLSVTQEFYKTRLAVYEAIHSSVLSVLEQARLMQMGTPSTTAVANSIRMLHSTYRSRSLYVSGDLRGKLAEFWLAAVAAGQAERVTSNTLKDLTQAAENIEQQMSTDLRVREIAQFPYITK